MPAPDLEAHEQLLNDRIMDVQNTTLTPEEALFRSAYNLIEEASRTDDTPRPRPSAGILHNGESWELDELLGTSVSKQGRESWTLLLLYDSAARDGGIRGKRAAYTGSNLLMEALEGWHITEGCPVSVERRRRFDARDEDGELIAIAGYLLDISYPVDYAT